MGRTLLEMMEGPGVSEAGSVTLRAGAVRRLTAEIFVACGAPRDLAEQVGEVLADNHLAGHDSHGLLRIPEYVASVQQGEIVPDARPEVVDETAVTALVRGHWAFGQVTANLAADLAIAKAQRERVGVVAVVEAGHTGRLAAFTERGARQNVAVLMAIGTVGSPITAPFGGAAAALGTNPFCWSVPNPDGPPITLDFATSAIAAGKIKVAKARHEPLPPGCILDRDGNPSTDPADFFNGGYLLPFAGHKGYALAVIAELLSGPLIGADAYPGKAQRSGIFLFALDASTFRPPAEYREALTRTTARIKGVPPAPGSDGVLLPGEPEAGSRARRERDGIPIPRDTWQAVSEVATSLGLDAAALVGRD